MCAPRKARQNRSPIHALCDVWFCLNRGKVLPAMKNRKIDIYMADVDRSLLRENLKLNFEQRAQKHLRALQMVEELRRAGKKLIQKRDGR